MSLIEQIQGRWIVTSFGVAEFSNFLKDQKVIEGDHGHNIINDTKWGYFSIIELKDGLVLNYRDDRNPHFMRGIWDVVRPDGDGWVGTLRYIHKPIFTFRLDRPGEGSGRADTHNNR